MTSVSNLEDEKVYDLGPELLNMAAVDETHMELPVLGRSASQPTLGARYTRQDPSSNVSRPADVRHILHVEWDEELQAFTVSSEVSTILLFFFILFRFQSGLRFAAEAIC